MKTRSEIKQGEYKIGLLVSDDVFLPREDVEALLLHVAHYWRGCTKEMALIKFGAFCVRCAPDELKGHLFRAKLRQQENGIRS